MSDTVRASSTPDKPDPVTVAELLAVIKVLPLDTVVQFQHFDAEDPRDATHYEIKQHRYGFVELVLS